MDARTVLVIDDDEVSRELMLLMLAHAGFPGVAAESGDQALAMLGTMRPGPFAVLADMQMPGTSGAELARQLRARCAAGTRLLAMSGSGARATEAGAFDQFLLKPISEDQLLAALDGGPPHAGEPEAGPAETPEPLAEVTFRRLQQSMPGPTLKQLYRVCVDDAAQKIASMRQACSSGDQATYRQAAHAIKGGCSMLGALELASLAREMEQNGIPDDGNVGALERFLVASARLRRILDAQMGQDS